MAQGKQILKQKPLTPDTFSDPSYYRPVDFSKHIPWLKNFHQVQPPKGAEIQVRKEESSK